MNQAATPITAPLLSGPSFVVQEVANPSSDYYIVPRTKIAGPMRVFNKSELPMAAELAGVSVIFVRYVPREWMRFVSRRRDAIRRVIYFMDDDMFDLRACRSMPLRYRLKLARLATLRKNWLRRIGAELWVSTPYLAQKYADWRPTVVAPLPLPVQRQPTRTGAPASVKVFYHGSASHAAEIKWLRPIMERVLQQAPGVSFEIIGTAAVNRLYRALPRASVVHPMSWGDYQAFCLSGARHIGLAPLLPSPYNAARSHTKFFDIERCGAAGIYSNTAPFADFVRQGEDGLLVDNNPDAWVDAILRLANNAVERERLAEGARRRVARLREPS